jgi:hypothetical protein
MDTSGRGGIGTMFESIDDRIKEDTKMPAKERLLEVLAVVVLAVVIFAGLFFGIRMLE